MNAAFAPAAQEREGRRCLTHRGGRLRRKRRAPGIRREKARLAAEAGESGMPWKRERSAAEGSRAGSSRRRHRMAGTEAAVRAESKGSFGGLGLPALRTRRAKVAYGVSLMSLSSARARGKAPWRRPLWKALAVCAGVGKTMFACASPRQWNVRSGGGKASSSSGWSRLTSLGAGAEGVEASEGFFALTSPPGRWSPQPGTPRRCSS